jgi:hypothetical protein
MVSFLEKFIRRSRKEELGIFWLFWICLLILNPVPTSGDRLPSIRYFIILIGMIVGGFVVWRILQKEKLRVVKNTVIGIEGFLILLFGSALAAILLMGGFYTLFGENVPQLVGIISGIALILIIIAPLSFLAGCLLGATVVKPYLLAIIWAIVLGLLLWRFGKGSVEVLLLLIPSIVGTYIGTSRLSLRS